MNQMRKIAGALFLAGGLMTGIQTVAAHHSMSMYDKSKVVTLDGTVVELRWANPHVMLVVSGKPADGDQAATWVLETGSPSRLERRGIWSATAMKPGDRVRVELNPHWESDNRTGRLWKATLVDTGQEFETEYLDSPRRQ
jgi:uncharacterized protein DUF6152